MDSQIDKVLDRKDPITPTRIFISFIGTPLLTVILSGINTYRYGFSKGTAWFVSISCFVFYLYLIYMGSGLRLLIVQVLLSLHQYFLYKKHFMDENEATNNDSIRLISIYGLLLIVSCLVTINTYQDRIQENSQSLQNKISISAPALESKINQTPNQNIEEVKPQLQKVESLNTEEIVAFKKFITSVINAKAEEKTVLREDKRIRNIEIKDKSINVELLADVSFSPELVKSIIFNKSTEIFKEAFRERNDISKITLDWQYPEIDAKGNEKIIPFISLTLSSDNEKTFNWDKVIFTRLPEAVDIYKEYFKK